VVWYVKLIIPGFSYKAVQLREAKAVTNDGEFKEIWSVLADMRYSDPQVQIFEALSFGLEGRADNIAE
jgi:hypothetical protein